MSHFRTCDTCGELYERPYAMKDKAWRGRRFCSVTCANVRESAEKNRYFDDAPSIALASANLRDHIFIMYARSAAKQGVTLKEAAYLMGMRV